MIFGLLLALLPLAVAVGVIRWALRNDDEVLTATYFDMVEEMRRYMVERGLSNYFPWESVL